jgi:hypothetical protein
MKFAAFDIEIAKELPEGCTDWREFAPLGVSCAAIATKEHGIELFHMPGAMSQADVLVFLARLDELAHDGYVPLSWNGTGFDYQVIAQECGDPETCAFMALESVDLMLDVTFRKGHFLGLDKALIGAGIAGKAHGVTLNDGTAIDDMGGAKAPTLWAQGEYSAVLAYLTRDVTALLDLVEWIGERKAIRWISGSGRPNAVPIATFRTVRELFDLPEPDTSWMTNPPQRTDFIAWMPEDIKSEFVWAEHNAS